MTWEELGRLVIALTLIGSVWRVIQVISESMGQLFQFFLGISNRLDTAIKKLDLILDRLGGKRE